MSNNNFNNYKNTNHEFNKFSEETFNRVNDLGHHVIGSLFEMAMPIINNVSKTNFNNPVNKPSWYPFSDIKETDSYIKILVSIPGVKKEDINIKMKNYLLIISANTSIKNNGWDHIEERNYSRQFKIPKYLTKDQLNVNYNNGILFIDIDRTINDDNNGETINVN